MAWHAFTEGGLRRQHVKAFAQASGLPERRIVEAISGVRRDLRFDRLSALESGTFMTLVMTFYGMANALKSCASAARWIVTDHPRLGGAAPIDLIRTWHGREALRAAVERARLGDDRQRASRQGNADDDGESE